MQEFHAKIIRFLDGYDFCSKGHERRKTEAVKRLEELKCTEKRLLQGQYQDWNYTDDIEKDLDFYNGLFVHPVLQCTSWYYTFTELEKLEQRKTFVDKLEAQRQQKIYILEAHQKEIEGH